MSADDESRWARLFADLEGELAAAEQADLLGEAADRTRREAGTLSLADRLRAAAGHPVTLHVQGCGSLPGRLLEVGPDWVLLAEVGGDALLPSARVLAVAGVGQAARPARRSAVGDRLDLRHALRGLVRDRAGVRLTLSDGTELAGTLDRVGADYVELAEHAPGEPRRVGAVRSVRAVPLTAIAVLRSARRG